MKTRSFFLPTLIALALGACQMDSDEERAASRAPGMTTPADASGRPAARPEHPPAQSRTQTGSVQSEPGADASANGNNGNQPTLEQQRVGPMPSQLTLDPAVPPATRTQQNGTPETATTTPPTDAQRVSESEARARCATLSGAPQEECLRNVERGFERTRANDLEDNDAEDKAGATDSGNNDATPPRGDA